MFRSEDEKNVCTLEGKSVIRSKIHNGMYFQLDRMALKTIGYIAWMKYPFVCVNLIELWNALKDLFIIY